MTETQLIEPVVVAKPVQTVQPMRGETLAFERLHALVRKGYVAEIGKEAANGGIALHHLGKAPDLLLHPDGMVEPLGQRIPRHKRKVREPGSIAAQREADQIEFMKFLDTVPKPNLRDRTRPFRKKYVYVPAALLILWGIMALFTVMIAEGF